MGSEMCIRDRFGIPFELTHDSGQELRGVYADGSEFELNLNFVDALEGCWLSLSTTVEPDSLNVVRGVQNSGTLADMLASDDSRAEFQPGFVLNSTEPPVWLEFDADVQDSVPSNLRVMVESQATTPGIEIEIGHGILQQKRTHLGCGLLASVFRPAVIEVEFANHFR